MHKKKVKFFKSIEKNIRSFEGYKKFLAMVIL